MVEVRGGCRQGEAEQMGDHGVGGGPQKKRLEEAARADHNARTAPLRGRSVMQGHRPPRKDRSAI